LQALGNYRKTQKTVDQDVRMIVDFSKEDDETDLFGVKQNMMILDSPKTGGSIFANSLIGLLSVGCITLAHFANKYKKQADAHKTDDFA
jgi:hypothetical protein